MDKNIALILPSVMTGTSFVSILMDPNGWKAFALAASIVFWGIVYLCYTAHEQLSITMSDFAEKMIDTHDRIETIESTLSKGKEGMLEFEKRLNSVQTLVGFKTVSR